MNGLKDIEKNLLALLSRLVLNSDTDAPSRLLAQGNALKKLKCDDPEVLGRFIASCDFPFLIETLVLDDAIFSQEFPEVRLTAEERKGFANALEAHCETCQRCHSKRAADLEWQTRMDSAFAENREVIGRAIARAAGKK